MNEKLEIQFPLPSGNIVLAFPDGTTSVEDKGKLCLVSSVLEMLIRRGAEKTKIQMDCDYKVWQYVYMLSLEHLQIFEHSKFVYVYNDPLVKEYVTIASKYRLQRALWLLSMAIQYQENCFDVAYELYELGLCYNEHLWVRLVKSLPSVQRLDAKLFSIYLDLNTKDRAVLLEAWCPLKSKIQVETLWKYIKNKSFVQKPIAYILSMYVEDPSLRAELRLIADNNYKDAYVKAYTTCATCEKVFRSFSGETIRSPVLPISYCNYKCDPNDPGY